MGARIVEELSPADAGLYLGGNLDVSAALGIPVLRSDLVERGRFLFTREPAGLIVGTRLVDPYEAVKREARRIVFDGFAARGLVPHAYAAEHRRRREAEDLIDQLVGSPPAWPT